MYGGVSWVLLRPCCLGISGDPPFRFFFFPLLLVVFTPRGDLQYNFLPRTKYAHVGDWIPRTILHARTNFEFILQATCVMDIEGFNLPRDNLLPVRRLKHV